MVTVSSRATARSSLLMLAANSPNGFRRDCREPMPQASRVLYSARWNGSSLAAAAADPSSETASDSFAVILKLPVLAERRVRLEVR